MLLMLATISVLIYGSRPAGAFQYVHLSQFGGPGGQAGGLSEPLGIAVSYSSADVYVADPGNHRVDKFDAGGNFLAAWGWGVADGLAQSEICFTVCQVGLEGQGNGQLTRPTAVAVDNSSDSSQGDVYVADSANDVIEKFDSNGDYISSLTGGSSGAFHIVYGVSVDGSGDVWADDSYGEVYEFGSEGSSIQQWNTRSGATPGMAVDASRDVYLDSCCSSMEMFTGAGRDLGELDPTNRNPTALASDLVHNKLFDDQGVFIAKYTAGVAPPLAPLTTFGQGILQHSAGVGAQPTSGDVYVADAASDEIHIFGPPPAGPPQIESVAATNVLATSANLRAMIYTGQKDTTYRFEYGPTEDYGYSAPADGADIGASIEDVKVSQPLEGLLPGMLYHYRVVAENIAGEQASKDRTFLTFPATVAPLPDGRAYELVSPADKNGGDVGFLGHVDTQAALSGEAVTYGSLTSYSTSPSAILLDQYLSTRSPGGWSTEGITPATVIGSGSNFSLPFEGFSAELGTAVLAWEEPSLTPDAQPHYRNLYLRDNSNGSYRLITVKPSSNGYQLLFAGASSTFDRVVFQAGSALTPEAAENAQNVYEWRAGHLALVSIPPGATAGTPGASAGGGYGDTQGAVSSDGSLIFWNDGGGGLYVRERGLSTVKLNASQRVPSLGDGIATFLGATQDGELAVFEDNVSLTEGPDHQGGLYLFETATGRLRDLSPNSAANPGVEGILGLGNGSQGSYVYFVAGEELAEGAKRGQPNLYVSHNGALHLIAVLSSDDSGDWEHQPVSRHGAVSPDGTHAVFVSDARLTEYDNADVNTGIPDSEVYEYDAQTAELHCISCNPSHEPPIGASSVPNWLNPNYNPRYLSDNGNRVFFNSFDSLTPRDINGMQDVYEWERGGACSDREGCIYLISSGTSASDSQFADASSSDRDAFFATSARLVAQDVDEKIDLYDAREHGGFAAPVTPAGCVGEACRAPLIAAPVLQTPGTAFATPLAQPYEGVPSTFTVAALDVRAGRRLARTGTLTLRVRVPAPGRVSASVTATIHGRTRRVAFGAVGASGAQIVRLVLHVSRAARRELIRRHRLRLTLSVSFSGSHQTRRLTITLYDPRSRG